MVVDLLDGLELCNDCDDWYHCWKPCLDAVNYQLRIEFCGYDEGEVDETGIYQNDV